jgi:hypothetical protein
MIWLALLVLMLLIAATPGIMLIFDARRDEGSDSAEQLGDGHSHSS